MVRSGLLVQVTFGVWVYLRNTQVLTSVIQYHSVSLMQDIIEIQNIQVQIPEAYFSALFTEQFHRNLSSLVTINCSHHYVHCNS